MKVGLSVSLASIVALAGCSQDNTNLPEKNSALSDRKIVTCSDFPEEKEYSDYLKRPVKVPMDLKNVVIASKTTLTIGHSDGEKSCVDISKLNISSIDRLANGRALGIALEGYEYSSYLVFDLIRKRDAIETGVAPAFAPSGLRFASIDASESAFGAFEAFGAWKIDSEDIHPIAVRENGEGFDITGNGFDWKVAGWNKDESCVLLSAYISSEAEAVQKRKTFHINLDAKPLQLQPGEACP